MRRMSLIVATAVIAGVVAVAPAYGQDDPATCLSLADFELHAATIVGTPGDDTLRGTEGPDVIVGLGGNDTIFGLGGDDIICGDLGDDRIDGGAGNDSIPRRHRYRASVTARVCPSVRRARAARAARADGCHWTGLGNATGLRLPSVSTARTPNR